MILKNMILKTEEYPDFKLVWELRGAYVYKKKITDDDEEIIDYFLVFKNSNWEKSQKSLDDFDNLGELKKVNKIMRLYLSLAGVGLASCLVAPRIAEFTTLYRERPSIYKTFLDWNNLSVSSKKELMYSDLTKLMEDNLHYEEEEKEVLQKEYLEFLNDYGQYYTRFDYLSTMLATRFVDIKKFLPLFTQDMVVGVYDKPIIYVENYEALFQEKILADEWLYDCIIRNIYSGLSDKARMNQEIYASICAKYGHEDICASYSLLGELVGKDFLEKCLLTGKTDDIWKKLKKNFPGEEEKIKELKALQLEIFRLEYNSGSDSKIVYVEKEMFLNIYRDLYEKKYNKSLEKDIVASFMQDIFLGNTDLKNKNKVSYGDDFLIGDITLDLSKRDLNYKDAIIQNILNSNNEQYAYFKEIWMYISYDFCGQRLDNYEEFEQSLSYYFTPNDVNVLFNRMLNCETLNEQWDIYEWFTLHIDSRSSSELLLLQKKR